MKHWIVTLLMLSSCIGTKARQEVLNPAAQTVWANVSVDYQLGLDDGYANGELSEAELVTFTGFGEQMTDALETGDVALLTAVPWVSMQPWAVRGVTSEVAKGNLGANGSVLLIQRINRFTAMIDLMVNPPVAARTEPNPYIRTPFERALLAEVSR